MSMLRITFRVFLVLVVVAMVWFGYTAWAKSKPEYFWSRAQSAEKAGDLETAQIHLQNLLRRFPEHSDGRKMLASVSLALAKKANAVASYASNPEALGQLAEAGKLRPDDLELQKELLAAHLARRQIRDAAEVAGKVVKLEPENQDALYALAVQNVRAKNPKAETYLTQLGEAPGRTFQAMSLSYEHYRNRNQPEKQQEVLTRASEQAAKRDVDELVKLSPQEQLALVSLIVIGVEQAPTADVVLQRADAGLDVFERYATKISADDAATMGTLALATTQLIAGMVRKHPAVVNSPAGDQLVERAAKLQAASVARGGAAPIVHQQLAWRQFTQGDYKTALETVNKKIDADAKAPAAEQAGADEMIPLRLLAAKAALALRRYDEANRHAQAVLDTKNVSKEWAGRAYLLAGSVASGQGRHEKALELFRRAEGQLGQIPEVRIGLASAHMALRQWKDALPHLNALQTAFNSRDAEQQFLAKQLEVTQLAIRWNQVRAHLALEQWKEAQPHFQAMQGTPLEPRSQAVAAVYLWSHGQRQAAMNLLEAARKKFPEDASLTQVQLAFLNQSGKADEVGQLIEQAAQAAPDDLSKQLMLANWRVQQGKREEALALIEDLEKRFSDASSLRLMKAQNLIALGRNAEAQQVADELRKSPQTEALGALIATAIEFQEKDLAGAAEQLQNLAEHAPDSGAVRLLQGEVAAAQGDYEAAVDSLGSALDVSAMRCRARMSLLRSLLLMAEKKGPAEAYRQLLPLVQEHPDDPFLLTVQADLLFKQGQFDQGMALLDRVEQLQPKLPDGAYIKAGIWLQRGDTMRALAEAERAVGLAPQHIPSLAMAAQLNLAAGKPQEAFARAQAALAINPQLWSLYVTQANALAQLKQSGKAITLLEGVIQKQPAFSAAQRALGALHAANGDMDRALEVIRAARGPLPNDLGLVADEVTLLIRKNQLAEAKAVAEKAATDQPSVDTSLTLARVFGSVGQFEAAREWGEKAMAQATDEQKPVVHLFLGDLALSEDSVRPDAKLKEAARDHFAAVIAVQPNHFLAGNNLAWLLATEFNQPQEAAQIVDNVRGQMTPALLPLTFLDTLAVVYRKANRAEDAERLLKQALTVDPEAPILLYHRGLALADLGRYAAARADLQRALELGLPTEKMAEARRALSAMPDVKSEAPAPNDGAQGDRG